MKKIYLIALLIGILIQTVEAQVTFTQTSTEDFTMGWHSNILVENGDIFLTPQATGINNWVATTNLPQPLTGHRIVTWKNFAYLVGGHNGSTNSSSIYKTTLLSSGIGTWSSVNALPVAVRDHAVVIGGNYIYVLGGIVNGTVSDQIYSALLNPDGSIGPWQTSIVSIPQPLWGHSAQIVDGFLYIIGGASLTSANSVSGLVYYSTIQPNGNLSPFSACVQLPESRNGHSCVNYDGNLYVFGGYDSTGIKKNTVYYTTIGSDGNCFNWSIADTLPVPMSNFASTCFNGILSIICGDIGGAVPLSRKVYTANIEDAPYFTWSLSNYELNQRRKDGQAFVSNGQIIFAGGENLSGNPVDIIRYSSLSMTSQVVSKAKFVSYPFMLGKNRPVTDLNYNISIDTLSSNFEIFYRTSGSNAEWNAWTSGGQSNPTQIGDSVTYVQYRFDFTTSGTSNIYLHDLTINISGYTELSGIIDNYDTLFVANSPYWATSNIYFTSGLHYIEPGVRIEFSPNTGLEIGNASLLADGNLNDSITFTYFEDEAGQWNGVHFTNESDNGVSSYLKYTIIEKAGYGNLNTNLYCSSTNQPSIFNSTFRSSVGHGIVLLNSHLNITNSGINNNTENGIYLYNSNPNLNTVSMNNNNNAGLYYAGAGINPTFTYCIISGNTYGIYSPSADNSFVTPDIAIYNMVNNQTDIALNGGTVTEDRSWAYFKNGYALLNDVFVKKSNDNPRLTIAPGNTIKFAAGAKLHIGGSSGQGGELYAEGNPDSSIVFTSLNDSIGGWDGMYFDDGSDAFSSTSSIKYCTIENASDYNLYAVNTHEPFVLYSTFRQSANKGIQLLNADLTIEESSVINNTNYGFYIDNSSPSLVLMDIKNNNLAGIYIINGDVIPSIFSCSIQNCIYGIYFPNPDISIGKLSSSISFVNVDSDVVIGGGEFCRTEPGNTALIIWRFLEI